MLNLNPFPHSSSGLNLGVKPLSLSKIEILAPIRASAQDIYSGILIRWISKGLTGNVKLEYSLDGESWVQIASVLVETATYTWTTAPDPAGESNWYIVQVRVTSEEKPMVNAMAEWRNYGAFISGGTVSVSSAEGYIQDNNETISSSLTGADYPAYIADDTGSVNGSTTATAD